MEPALIAYWLEFSTLTTWAAQVRLLGVEPHHSSVSSHAVAAAHTEEQEEPTIRIYNYVQELWGGKKEKSKATLKAF